MTRIRLVHWNEVEARQRMSELEAAGYRVDFEPLKDQTSLRKIQGTKPAAIVIDLCRRPSQGRDLALWLRKQKKTRQVPLVFLGGVEEKVERLRGLLPDAVYADWSSFRGPLKLAIDQPAANPVVPESALAGYSGTPLPRKLGIKPGSTVALISAPRDFEVKLGELPKGVVLRPSGRGRRDLTICFVRSRRELARRIERLVEVSQQGNVWIAWPKKVSALESDLTQAEVRKAGLAAGLVDFKICAIDETWSALCFALRRG